MSMCEFTNFDRRTHIYDNAIECIGNTPLMYLNKICKDLPAKIVKDRVGFQMIEDAERKGLVKPGITTLIEPTSGNMGIALAFASAVKGYRLILTMPSSMSIERRAILKAYGAEVVLTDPAQAVVGALTRAYELAEIIPNSYVLNQFENPANIEMHYATTGPEIWSQTNGKVDICCFGVGSGGTIMGVSKYLKERKPGVKTYAVEPFESSVLNGLPHSPHKIPGMGAGLIPGIVNCDAFEEALRVKSDDAINMARRLAREEGLLVGVSSGANVCAAIQLAMRPENAGKLIVTSCASFGDRYLSTDLYKDLKEESEKMKITSLDEDRNHLKHKFNIKFIDEAQ